jgi:hypothetical protein
MKEYALRSSWQSGRLQSALRRVATLFRILRRIALAAVATAGRAAELWHLALGIANAAALPAGVRVSRTQLSRTFSSLPA